MIKKMIKNLELPQLKCKKCDYEWKIRIPSPRKCPKCGFRIELEYEKENEAKPQ